MCKKNFEGTKIHFMNRIEEEISGNKEGPIMGSFLD